MPRLCPCRKKTFDFFYLPLDYETSANKGYAFVNFRFPTAAAHFYATFHGKKLKNFKSHKIIQVEIASVQGFKANYDHFKGKQDLLANLKPEFQPIFIFDRLPAKISLQTATDFASSENWSSVFRSQTDASVPAKVVVPSLLANGADVDALSSQETVYAESIADAARSDSDEDDNKHSQTMQIPEPVMEVFKPSPLTVYRSSV